MLNIRISDATDPPFDVEAMVLEEDTGRVIAGVKSIRDVAEEVPSLINAMADSPVHRPGSIVVRGSRIYALVHDFDEDPSCRRQWVVEALDAVAAHVRSRGLESIAVQALGAVYGNLPAAWVIDEIEKRLTRATCLRRLWIIERVPPGR